MIFSKFLKKKWQHKDSNVRIEAINNALSVTDTEQRAIISQLALQDDSENVRRAALIKLADYSVWLTHSQLNSMAKIKQYAQKKVEAILTDQDSLHVTEQQKLDYISDYEQFSFYESWLKQTDNANIIIALFEKLAEKNTKGKGESTVIKPQLLLSLFSQKKNKDVQQYIVAKATELEVLEKLKKKSSLDDITVEIDNKLLHLREVKEKPIRLQKRIGLNLAKLQALKEQSNYEEYLTKRHELSQEWQEITTQLACLDKVDQDNYVDKQAIISQQLDNIFIAKKEQYEQDKIAQKLIEAKQQARQNFDKTFTIISQTLTTSIFENDEIDENKYQSLFEKLIGDINNSLLSDDEKADYLRKIEQQKHKLQQLPVIAASVAKATQLVSRISQLALPTTNEELNERLAIYNQWQQDWKDVEKSASGSLPESITSAAKEIQKEWNNGIKPLQQAQKKDFLQTQKKLHDVKRLINNGKYNAAFGIYKKSKSLYTALSDAQQQKLQREFDNVTTQIDDLADWEHYIATPRKKELLVEIKQIVDTPLDNPNEQAEKVKTYRKIWNSLGHADDENEKRLNDEFNQLCESAFTPCRLFFAEQEKLREQHLVVRQAILDDAIALGIAFKDSHQEEILDIKSFDTQINKLQQLWQNAGQVDRAVYRKLNDEFNGALQPIKSAVKQFHKTNADKKQAIIDATHALIALDDIASAVQDVKAFQQQWREIGYAGPRLENKLWQAFRKVNDQIFAKRDEKSSSDNAQLELKKAAFIDELQTLTSQYNTSVGLDTLVKQLEALDKLKAKVRNARVQSAELNQGINELENKINQQTIAVKQQQEKQHWTLLFNIIETAISDGTNLEEITEFNALSHFWQKKLKELSHASQSVDRAQATLELEILAGIPSPEQYQQQRMAVQVNLIQDQMSSGAVINLKDRFATWLTLGKLTQDDLLLLARLKPIFV